MPLTHKRPGHRSRPLSRQVDLNLLELFDTVYRVRNLTAAGAWLGLSQPAVSRGLARLRETYGDALFVRQQRGVAPTPFADQLAAPVSAALNALRSTLESPAFDPAVQSRTFRLAMSDVGERIFLPRLLNHLSLAAPNVRIDVLSPTQEQLQEGLASGRIDMAAGFFGELSKQVRQQRLFSERFVYVARQDHPAIEDRLRREQLRELPHVIGGPEGMRHAAAVEKVLAGPRIRARVVLRVHSLLCIGPAVAENDSIGLIPGNLAAVVATNVPLRLLEPPMQVPGFDVTMVWHDRFHREPANEWLRGVFVQLFEGLKLPAPGNPG
jgi:DNA-binding transcriptional LysR family regulator